MTPVWHTPWITLYHGDCRAVLPTLPEASVQCVVTSPPYWGLRDYGVEPSVWDDPGDCAHVWGGWKSHHDVRETSRHGKSRTTERYYGHPSRRFNGNHETHTAGQSCQHCAAWRGCLGHEPRPDDYIRHLVIIFKAVKRVLRPDGTLWLVIGDSYSSGNRMTHGTRVGQKQATNRGSNGVADAPRLPQPPGLKPKDLCLIPFRLALALQEAGW